MPLETCKYLKFSGYRFDNKLGGRRISECAQLQNGRQGPSDLTKYVCGGQVHQSLCRSPIGHKHPKTPTGKAALGKRTRSKSFYQHRVLVFANMKKVLVATAGKKG